MTVVETLSASLEDYLEAIFHIAREKHVARPRDIAGKLRVSYPSVTSALRALAERGLINYTPYDAVTLTDKGRTAAQDVIRRHETLRRFFVDVLAVSEKEAEVAACRMEHSVPEVILNRLSRFARFVESCPRGGNSWIAGFGYQCDEHLDPANCERCMSETMRDYKDRRMKEDSQPIRAKTLNDLKPGEKGRVLRVRGLQDSSKRMAEMGVVPGTIVEVERVAPLGDPIDVKIKGYHLSLRREEAAAVDVETD